MLMIASILSVGYFEHQNFYLLYAIIFVVSLAAFGFRALSKPEQDWYKSRALAESVKTLTWRYIMRADPFENSMDASVPRKEFRDHLHEIFRANQDVAKKIDNEWSAEDQITKVMDNFRKMPLLERVQKYRTDRVIEQRDWYRSKSKYNQEKAKIWIIAGLGAYAIAIILVLCRIAYPQFQPWPIEPVIVFASSAIGWMQIKKYNELVAAYTVTAHEIGLISPKIDAAIEEEELSEAVNEAELAFSREHTLWIARKTD